MKYKKYISLIMISIFGLAFNGCVPKMPKATPEQDSFAKKFTTTPEKSNIYICRNETLGWAINMPLTLDGKFIGKTEGSSYFYLTVNPGQHTIQSLTENVQTLPLNTEKNKNYFVWQEVKMGMWAADSKLHLVNENHNFGKKCVLSTQMLKEN